MPCKIIKNDNRYQFRNGADSLTELLMYICICKGIKESDVRELGQAAITCPKKIANSLGLDDKKNCCGRCIKNISKFVALAVEEVTYPKSPMMS